MSKLWSKLLNNQFFKFGLPFITFMIVAPFGLKEFQAIKISERDRRRGRFLTTDEEYKTEQRKVAKFDIEEELRKTKEKLNIGQWENKRVPRPWDE